MGFPVFYSILYFRGTWNEILYQKNDGLDIFEVLGVIFSFKAAVSSIVHTVSIFPILHRYIIKLHTEKAAILAAFFMYSKSDLRESDV